MRISGFAIPGLVPGSQLTACSEARGWLDPGDERRDDIDLREERA
jgi:hypothetical protein